MRWKPRKDASSSLLLERDSNLAKRLLGQAWVLSSGDRAGQTLGARQLDIRGEIIKFYRDLWGEKAGKGILHRIIKHKTRSRALEQKARDISRALGFTGLFKSSG